MSAGIDFPYRKAVFQGWQRTGAMLGLPNYCLGWPA